MNVIDLYAGAGGWDCAANGLGFDPLGIEWDHDACETRRAAGMPTIEEDITTLDPADFGAIDGLIASPPCQSFSAAGNRAGLADERGQLVWTPVEWAERLRPRWCAWEQVPAVLDIWRMSAHRLEAIGYYAAVGLLHSEQYGVPQTRTRAILLAHRDRPVSLPAPTHQRFVSGVPQGDPEACGIDSLFGDPLKPWVSMAEALGWGMTARPSVTLAPGTDSGGPDFGGGSGARATLKGEREAGRWVVRSGQYSRTAGGGSEEFTRPVDEPAPTLGTMSPGQWVIDRPATTGTTESRIGAPSHHDENRRSFSEDAIRLTVAEAAALQTFPPEHPWQGSRTAQHRQIGNAIPPMLAKAVLGQVIA